MLPRDAERYEYLLASIASISGLFSKSDVPYVDSRFVENLFVTTTGAVDCGRADMSFDALLPGGIGVGIKTFVGGNACHKNEKVAEFTTLAREGHFRGVGKKELVRRIAVARNARISANAAEYAIDLDKCVYHCLIRLPGGAVVHEEPYRLIDVSNLRPLTKSGRPAEGWSDMGEGVFFTDGISRYSYSVSKNVLIKRFEFDPTSGFMPLAIHPDPLSLLDQLVGRAPSTRRTTMASSSAMAIDVNEDPGRPGIDYIILPLYSPRDHVVHPKSGLNQWNAGGRTRTFGEAYVLIPAELRDQFPSFFPPQHEHFDLILPNGNAVRRAKVCQQGGKALMTESNIELGRWLISVIDPTTRLSDFGGPVGRRRPYTYADLAAIGSDSVMIRREGKGKSAKYSAKFASLGSYEDFMESNGS